MIKIMFVFMVGVISAGATCVDKNPAQVCSDAAKKVAFLVEMKTGSYRFSPQQVNSVDSSKVASYQSHVSIDDNIGLSDYLCNFVVYKRTPNGLSQIKAPYNIYINKKTCDVSTVVYRDYGY